MANLLDVYARTAGLRIDKMHLFEQFYPLPVDGKYVVFISSSGQPAKSYNYFREALWFMADGLKEAGLTTVQAGLKEDLRIGCQVDICGETNPAQFFYVISNAELIICGDTSALHAAGHYNVPVISLFAITDPKISGAIFGDKSKQVYLTPDIEGHRPSFDSNENPKTINRIYPERIVSAAKQLLGVNGREVETLKIGNKYHINGVEVVPDHTFARDTLPGVPLNLRLDFGGREEIAFHFLSHRRCNLVTNTAVNINALKVFKSNLENLIYSVDDNYDLSFIAALKQNAIPFALMTDFPQEKIDSLKEKFMDYGILQKRDFKTREDIDRPELINPETKFRTGKFIISQGRIFMSRAHLEADESIDSLDDNYGTIIDSPEFWKEQDFFYLYNEK